MFRPLLSLLMLAALATATRAQETLTVYTYESFVSEWGPGARIEAAFEKECGCNLKWIAVTDGVAMLNRLKLETDATVADAVLGLDTSITAEAADTGLFEAHGLDTSGLSIPAAWTDPLFVPYDYAHFAVIYDSRAVSAPPRSLDELVNGDPAQKIVLEDPRSSTPGLGFLLWMKAVYGENAGAAWAKLKDRVLTTTPGWTEAYGLFTRGEAPMVLSYTTSPAYHLIAEQSDRYRAAAFSEGHYLQIEVAGLISVSKHKALARKFLAFTMTPGFQDAIPEGNWMFPAGPTTAPLNAAFETLVKPAKTFHFDPRDVAARRREWIGEWLNAVGG